MGLAKKFAIFDMDGTMLNTLEDLKDSTNYLLSKNGFKERTLEEVRQFVGNGLRKLLERAVPAEVDKHSDFFEKLFAEFCLYYKEHCNIKTAPYNGANEMLDKINAAGYCSAIVSNKIDSAVKDLSKKFFGNRLKSAIGEREGVEHKPAPDMVYIAMKELGATKENSVYIGDSEVDLKTAENSGLPCISVLWGFRDKAFLEEHGGNTFVNTMEELANKLIELGS